MKEKKVMFSQTTHTPTTCGGVGGGTSHSESEQSDPDWFYHSFMFLIKYFLTNLGLLTSLICFYFSLHR